MFGSAVAQLRPHGPAREGIDVARFLKDFREWYAAAAAGPTDPVGGYPRILRREGGEKEPA